MNDLTLKETVIKLYDVEGIKFGKFTMRTGEISPFYIDMRVIWSYPIIVKSVCGLLWEKIQAVKPDYQLICGLPYQGIPIGSVISIQHNIPMILKRQQPKQYGTKRLMEGHYKDGDSILLLDDVLMTGSTLIDEVPIFRKEGIDVSCAVVFLDRDQGGKERVKKLLGLDAHCVLTINDCFKYLLDAGRVTEETLAETRDYLQKTRFDTAEYISNK